MPTRGMLSFADASFSFEDAFFVLFGVPFDRTTTFRSGARFAPTAIREASINFEPDMLEHDVDLREVPFHDMGDLHEEGTADAMTLSIEEEAKRLVSAGKFPIAIGGEHSISPPVVKAFGSGISVVIIDAHLDYNDEYQGLKNSHACAHKRIEDTVGRGNVFAFGVRSMSRDEHPEDAVYADSYTVYERGCEEVFDEMLSRLKREPVYLSLDIDGIDPAYAPGTGTPEPFGLTAFDVRHIINALSDRLVGFDVVEVCPPCDNGNTSVLAARLVREVVAVKWKSLKRRR
ncbi:MAG: agmatinase [Methanobacteriota archaeon]|nr:MAG: agmatinase [Euryarchaeota archaeon]